jgi:hypothetical protein
MEIQQITKYIDKIKFKIGSVRENGDFFIVNESKIVKPHPDGIEKGIEYISYLHFKEENLAFSIRKISQDKTNRMFVKIYSHNSRTDKLSSHFYYLSNSDGNYWRYCIDDSTVFANTYSKGYNYVVTTLMNIYLMLFINTQIPKFKIIKEEINCIRGGEYHSDEWLVSRITTNKNISGNQIFKTFDTIFTRERFDREKFDPSKGKSGMMHIFVDYENRLNILQSKIQELIEKSKISILSKDDILEHKVLNQFKTSLEKFNVYKKPNGLKIIFFTNVYKAFNDVFTAFFTLGKSYIIGKHQFTLGTYSVDMRIYSMIIKCNEVDKLYKLFYSVYKYKINDGEYSKFLKTIIHIIPIDGNSITAYGLDNRYVSAGFYINKIFDYKIQSEGLEIADRSVNKDYYFLGDIIHMDYLPFDESKDAF